VLGVLAADLIILCLISVWERFPAHHNLNNQQLKLLIPNGQHNSNIPAHHNLNNQQLKQVKSSMSPPFSGFIR
jgi:hypothetical protein